VHAVIRSHPFLVALAPVASTIGARIVGPGDRQHGDVALRWEGELVGYLRMPTAATALDQLMFEVEEELGQELQGLNKDERQRAVKLLDERGAFSLRKSVEEVADVLGVSRITIYNYLNAIRKDGTHRSGSIVQD
jgi:DNA-binding CsgD family transcriptional regulator